MQNFLLLLQVCNCRIIAFSSLRMRMFLAQNIIVASYFFNVQLYRFTASSYVSRVRISYGDGHTDPQTLWIIEDLSILKTFLCIFTE